MTAEMKVEPGAGAVRADEGVLVRIAIGFTLWAERWFPDAFIFVAIAVVVVSLAALGNGATPLAVSRAFGDGFWSLIPFTMQMTFVVIGGYVVATSAPAQRLIRSFAAIPKNGISAVGLVAAVSMLASLLNWGLSLIFGGLLVRTLAERRELKMDYRAAAAAAYSGSAQPGQWGCRRRPRNCRPMPEACRNRCCRSPALFHFPRRSFCGSRW
jgi:short-chain fatty acids transporter